MLRHARVRDVKAIKSLIERFREEGSLLPRPLTEIYESIRDFFVVEENSRVVGCVALHVVWEDLAEIKTLVVDSGFRGRGYGTLLILAAMREARDLEIERVFALTASPSYFLSRGFEPIDKSKLPHKIWAECVKCHKFPDCDEVAVGATVSQWFASYGKKIEAAEVA